MSTPHLEDLWEDCQDKREIDKGNHSRLHLSQVTTMQLCMNVEGFEDIKFDIIELGYQRERYAVAHNRLGLRRGR